MITIIDKDQALEFYKRIDDKTKSKMHATKSFVIISEKKQYIVSFTWMDNSRVMALADSDACIVMTSNENIKAFTKEIDYPENRKEELFYFLLALMNDEVERLETFETEISDMEKVLLTESRPSRDGINHIISMKSKVSKLKHYYIQMEFLADDLSADEHYFDFVERRFDRLLNYTMHLEESIEQVREAYQSQMDIEQNNLMKFFTVLTSIFFPLTLITGWYGMNLIMPEFKWMHGYPYVIGLSLVVVAIQLIIFKKRKWL